MATEIIGLDSTNKILNSAIFTKDKIGFGVLVETYTLTPEGLENFNPQNLDPHPSFPTMTVEASDSEDILGGLKRLTIRYVGAIKPESERYIGKPASQIPQQPDELSDSDFAPPEVLLFPAGKKQLMPSQLNDPSIDSNFFFSQIISGESKGQWVVYPFVVNIRYIETGSLEKEEEFIDTYKIGETPIPEFIRDYQLPSIPVSPFQDATTNPALVVNYNGVLCSSASFERRGKINIMSLSFKDNFQSINI